MISNDWQNDPSVARLATLRTYDVSERRADRLRRRCHVLLQAHTRPKVRAGLANGTLFPRIVVPVLGGAWCLAYLVEIVRIAAAIYR